MVSNRETDGAFFCTLAEAYEAGMTLEFFLNPRIRPPKSCRTGQSAKTRGWCKLIPSIFFIFCFLCSFKVLDQTMHDNIEIRSFQQEDEAPWSNYGKMRLVVAWNDPSKDISRKVQLDPEGLLLGWYDNSLIASWQAMKAIVGGSITSPLIRNIDGRD